MFKPRPSGPLVDRLVEARREEDKAQRREAELEASAVELIAFAQRVRDQLKVVRTEALRLGQAGVEPSVVAQVQERLGAAVVPPLEVDAASARALKTRAELLERRTEAASALDGALGAYREQLTRLWEQLTADERHLEALKERHRREREAPQRPAQPPRPPPAARAPEAADALIVTEEPPREVKLKAVVDFESDTNFFTGFSGDVRRGGLFVATLLKVRTGTQVELTFSLPDGQELSARGVVSWRREGRFRDPDIFPGVGVQFLELPERAAAEVARFMARREPLFFPG